MYKNESINFKHMLFSPATGKEIFSVLRKAVFEYCPPLVSKKNSPDAFEVMGNIAVPYGSKKVMVEGMYFASALIRKDNVSFYFFPCYTHADQFRNIAPVTLKCLDGKTCFHFKKEEQLVESEIKAMIEKGIAFYRKNGWMK